MSALLQHLPVLPILIPLLAGALLTLLGGKASAASTFVGGLGLAAVLASAVALAGLTLDGTVLSYLPGNWPVPAGIAVAVDRLAALMLLVTAVVAIAAWLAARDGLERRGPFFQALLQFQLMGLNGAFLTADLFNLFVFFEVLLISSYALLLQAGGAQQVKASLPYVALNLLGSTLFLFGVSLLYGVLGTLNLADLAVRAASAPAEDATLVRSAGLMLLVVFALKGAVLPLGFWLPATYSSAAAPVAALFAIMTKVGVYSIARVYTLVFGASAGAVAETGHAVLLVASLASLALAIFGLLAARDLRGLAAWAILASAGTMLALVALGTPQSLAATLFYLPQTTFAAALLFLVADLVARERGSALEDRLVAGAPIARAAGIGAVFFFAAVALAGLPPLAGFAAKLLVLDAAQAHVAQAWIWTLVLGVTLASVIAFSRAGSVLFWKPVALAEVNADGTGAAKGARVPLAGGTVTACALLVAVGLAIVFLARPLQAQTAAAGAQLVEARSYVRAVLAARPVQRVAEVQP